MTHWPGTCLSILGSTDYTGRLVGVWVDAWLDLRASGPPTPRVETQWPVNQDKAVGANNKVHRIRNTGIGKDTIIHGYAGIA